MRDILKGEYRNIEGEERLLVSDSQYVKLNFASSGQQEVVFVYNLRQFVFRYFSANVVRIQ